jgi:hypothetical protein
MRIVGCTGVPADSHDVVWFQVAKEKTRRCPECGSGTLLYPLLLSYGTRFANNGTIQRMLSTTTVLSTTMPTTTRALF